jgi:hypothetical protein
MYCAMFLKTKTRISTGLEAGYWTFLDFLKLLLGGEGRIRTDGTPKRTLDFESSAFDHSATSPDTGRFAAINAAKRKIIAEPHSVSHPDPP